MYVARGTPADALEAIGIATQERAVVAADIQDGQILAGDQRGRLGDDAFEMVTHRLVDAGAVPIVGIEHLGRKRVAELQ